MKKTIHLLFIFVAILFFTGCFEPTGKVQLSSNKNNATFYIDGEKVDATKAVDVVVGIHTVKVIAPIDDQWQYTGEKKFQVQKDQTTKVNIYAIKSPTQKRISTLKSLENFDPLSYKFTYYKKYTPQEIKAIKIKVDTLIKKEKYDQILPKDIVAINYQDKLKKLHKQLQLKIKNSVQLFKTLKGHRYCVNTVAMKGDYIVSGSDDRTIKVWSLKNGNLLRTLKNDRYAVESVVIDGNYIISASYGSITVWPLTKKAISPIKVLKDPRNRIYAVAARHNYIVSGGYNDNALKIWLLPNSKPIKTLTGHQGRICSVALKKGYIVSGSRDNTIKIWSSKGKLLRTLVGHKYNVNAVVIKDDYIISGSADRTIKIWSLKTGTLLKTLKGHKEDVTSVAVEGDYIVSGSDDNTIKIWSFKTGELLKTIQASRYDNIYAVAIEGNYIVSGSGDHTVKIWKLNKDFKNISHNKAVEKKLNILLNKLKNHSIDLKDLNIKYDMVYKYGKIGEIYVPTISWSSSTPHTTTTYINGKSYTQTTYTHHTNVDSGYTKDRQGYKAVNRLTNNSNNYYFIKIKSSWKGKYTSVKVRSNWGGDKKRVWKQKYQDGYQYNTFIIPPHKYVKYQFEIGEEKEPINTQILQAFIVPKEYAEKLFESLNEKNEYLILIDKFLKDNRIEAWHSKLKKLKEDIEKRRNLEFYKANKNDVKLSIKLSPDYDPDFGGDVTINIETPRAMCVHVKTPFGIKKIYADGKVTKVYKKIQDIPKNPSISLDNITINCK